MRKWLLWPKTWKASPKTSKPSAYDLKKRELEARRAALLEKEQEQANAVLVGGSGSVPTAGAKPSSFFAYDDREVKKGLREFQNLWGGRALQDNWRRSNAQNPDELLDDELSEEDLLAAITDEEVADILKDVPANDRLHRPDKSVEILEEMLRRYPDSRFELDALYFLYLAYLELDKEEEAKKIAALILKRYPDSTYAHILQDPDYLSKQVSEEERIAQYYEQMYELFESGQYARVHDMAKEAEQKFGLKQYARREVCQRNVAAPRGLCGRSQGPQARQQFAV